MYIVYLKMFNVYQIFFTFIWKNYTCVKNKTKTNRETKKTKTVQIKPTYNKEKTQRKPMKGKESQRIMKRKWQHKKTGGEIKNQREKNKKLKDRKLTPKSENQTEKTHTGKTTQTVKKRPKE